MGITFSKIYHMLGLSDNLTKTVFVYLCVFVYLGVRHVGTMFLRSLYDFLFKNISHHGSFLLQSYKWMGLGWIGLDGNLCVGLFYEHRFAMLINILIPRP